MNSKTIADFIKLVDNKVIINTNQAASPQDMSIIIKTNKDTINVNLDFIKNLHLPKFKLYLKIDSLSYHVETTNTLVTHFLVKEVLKNIYIHIFNNIILTSKLQIIKAISNSDSAVI